MSNFAQDTNSAGDPNGTTLASHLDDLGNSWAKANGNTGSVDLQSSLLQMSSSGSEASYYNSGTPSSADYNVQATLHYNTSVGQLAGVIGRCDTSQGVDTFYCARYNNDNADWELYAFKLNVGGSGVNYSLLGTHSQTLTTGTNHIVVLGMHGTTISVTVDSTQVISVTDSNISAAGKSGVQFYGSNNNMTLGAFSAYGNTPTLTVAPTTGFAADNLTTLSMTPTLTNSSASLTAGVSGGGTISTTSPTSGTPFSYTPPTSGSGTAIVTVTDTTDSLIAHCTITYRPAETFYVNTSGSDSNNGTTTGTPWQTIGHVNAQTFVPGDSILFQSGQSFSGNLHLSAQSGYPGLPITVGTYGGSSNATISCSNSYGIWLDECQYVTVENLTITGSGVSSGGVTTSTAAGFLATLAGAADLPGVILKNCTISGTYYGVNLHVAAAATNHFVGPVLWGNTISQCAFSGILIGHLTGSSPSYGAHDLRFTQPVIRLNTISDIYGATNAAEVAVGDWPSNTTSGFGVMVYNCSGGLIGDNLIRRLAIASSNTSAGGSCSILVCESNGLRVVLNECHTLANNSGVDSAAIDCDGGAVNCIVERNYCHDITGPGYYCFNIGGAWTQTTGNTFRWNVGQNNALSGGLQGSLIAARNGPTNTLVHNNTDYCSSGHQSLGVDSTSGTGTVIRDNVIAITGGSATFGGVPSGVTLQGNRWVTLGGAGFNFSYNSTVYNSLAALQAAGVETVNGVNVGSTGDPHLANPYGGGSDYTPGTLAQALTAYDPSSIASSCLSAGLDMAGVFGLDPGGGDFHGGPVRPAPGTYPVGAVATALPVINVVRLRRGTP